MIINEKDSKLEIKLEGRIDTNNAPDVEQEIMSALDANDGKGKSLKISIKISVLVLHNSLEFSIKSILVDFVFISTNFISFRFLSSSFIAPCGSIIITLYSSW